MKEKTVFVCSSCGNESAKWLGKCPNCDSWGTMEEQVIKVQNKSQKEKETTVKTQTVKLSDVESTEFKRFSSGSGELDRVLGGGIVPGSIVLCGGDPGI